MSAVLAGVLFAGGLAGSLRNPLWPVVGLAVLLPLDFPLELPPTVYVNEAFLAGAALGWGIRLLRTPRALPAVWHEYWFFAPFLLMVLLSAVTAGDLWGVLKQFLRWSEVVLAVMLVGTGIARREGFRPVLAAMLTMGVLTSLLGLAQHYLGESLLPGLLRGPDGMQQFSDVVRAFATFGHPNQFAGYLILTVPLSLALFFEQRTRPGLLLFGLATLVLLLALAVTYSRGGWVGALLALAVVLFYYLPKNLLRSALLAAAFVGVLLTLPLYVSKLNTRLGSLVHPQQDAAVTGRILYQREAWRLIARRPVLGYGAGRYAEAMDAFLRAHPGERPFLGRHIHNLYTQIALETGLAGLAAFLFFLGMIARRWLRGLRAMTAFSDRALLVALAAGVLAFLVHNLFDVLTVYARGVHLALILGLGFAWVRLTQRELWTAPSEPEGTHAA